MMMMMMIIITAATTTTMFVDFLLPNRPDICKNFSVHKKALVLIY